MWRCRRRRLRRRWWRTTATATLVKPCTPIHHLPNPRARSRESSVQCQSVWQQVFPTAVTRESNHSTEFKFLILYIAHPRSNLLFCCDIWFAFATNEFCSSYRSRPFTVDEWFSWKAPEMFASVFESFSIFSSNHKQSQNKCDPLFSSASLECLTRVFKWV